MNKKSPLVFLFSLALYLPGLYLLEITRINCRFALMTAEIGKLGAGLFPTMNGAAYTDYPVSLLYLMHLATFGGRFENMLTLALPTAIIMALTVMVTYNLGEKLHKNLGFYAAAFCFLSFELINIARIPSIDAPVALAVVSTIYCLYVGEKEKKPFLLIWPVFWFGFSFFFRGPLGLVLINAAVAGYFLAAFNWKKLVAWGAICGLLTAGYLALGYYTIHWAGGEELWNLFWMDQVASRVEYNKGFFYVFYYFTNAIGSFAPAYLLGLLVFACYLKKLFVISKEESDEMKFLRMLFGWSMVSLLLLSIPGTKHLRYATAVLPALCLAAAWGFMNFDRKKSFAFVRNILLTLCRYLPLAGVVAGLAFAITLTVLRGFGHGLFPLILFTLIAVLSYRRKPETPMALMALGAVVFTLIVTQVATPLDSISQNSRAFVRQIEPLITGGELYFYRVGVDGDEFKLLINLPPEKRFAGKYIMPFYSQKEIATINQRGMFHCIGGLEAMEALPGNALFLARIDKLKPLVPDKDLDALQKRYEILARGKMGHREYVLFRKAAAK